jgi:exodeoxyribonuclease VII large subunit
MNLNTNSLTSPSDDSFEARIFSVSDITEDIKTILESAFEAVWIEGEISNYRVAASNHAYFVLKDERSQIRSVMFRFKKDRLRFTPEDGDQVLLFGRMSIYNARGEYQIIVESMEPRGLGALQKAFEQLKDKLSKEGLFEDSSKKEIPWFPWKVGVVTSPTGAAVRDIIEVISRRNPSTSILLSPVRVQGDGSAEEIAEAIQDMNQLSDIDVLIVGRGGGSIEDLWAFNEEVVARAIYNSKIPIISAVGHEIDFTITDFIADLRAPTPSAAAELAVPELSDILSELRVNSESLVQTIREKVENHYQQLNNFTNRRFFLNPMEIIQPAAQRLDDLNQRLARAPSQGLKLRKERLRGTIQNLFHNSPKKRFQNLKDRLIDRARRLSRAPQQTLSIKKEQLKTSFQVLLLNSPKRDLSISKNKLIDIGNRLIRAPGQGIKLKKERLRQSYQALAYNSPTIKLHSHEEKLHALSSQLIRKMSSVAQLKREQLAGLGKSLNALSPLEVLDRGYSVTFSKATGKAIKNIKEVKPGDKVQTLLSKGKLSCTVDKIIENQL